ncbi:TetR/AcrR family transcriptional regulator [Rhodococcus triatomae]
MHTSDGDPTAPNLRERRRRETRSEISDAALALFEERGYAGTTVDDIAQRAGVSQRTVFRYFDTKEATVLGGVEDLAAELTAALVDEMPENLVLQHVEAAHLRLLEEFVDDRPETIRRIRRIRCLILKDPDLRGAAALMELENVRTLTARIAEHLSPDVNPILPRLLAEAGFTTLRVAFDAWVEKVEAGEKADLTTVYRDCRTTLHGLLGPTATDETPRSGPAHSG